MRCTLTNKPTLTSHWACVMCVCVCVWEVGYLLLFMAFISLSVPHPFICRTILIETQSLFWESLIVSSAKKARALCRRPEVGKLRPGGHLWPDELLNPAHRAFTRISPKPNKKVAVDLLEKGSHTTAPPFS